MNIAQLRSQLQRPQSTAFVDAWLRWRGDRLLPEKSELNLRDIVRSLSTIILFQVIDDDTIVVRVAGTRLADVRGGELTGKNYRDLTAPADWSERSRRFRNMTSRPCGGFMKVTNQVDDTPVFFEAVNLPLTGADTDAGPYMLCCNTPLDPSFAVARQLQPRHVPAVIDFVYVDIGAGLPDG